MAERPNLREELMALRREVDALRAAHAASGEQAIGGA